MDYKSGQILARTLQVLYRHTEIMSGAYKLPRSQQGVSPEDVDKLRNSGVNVMEANGSFWRDLTDDEKLANSMDIMRRQIQIVHDCVDGLYEGGSAEDNEDQE
jgi:hypothetical protein|tara:strand:+ start:11946 stop:12254 length:309 start_codon:yes stop_codon:yes gene_type:complete